MLGISVSGVDKTWHYFSFLLRVKTFHHTQTFFANATQQAKEKKSIFLAEPYQELPVL
jgi:hypothetical protein